MNMKFAAATVLGLLSLAALAPTAAAADNGFYLGGGLSNTNFDVEVDGVSDDFDDNGFKVIAGFRPLNWLAFEANYIDLGGTDEDGLSIDSNAFTALRTGARGNRHRRSVCPRRHGQLEYGFFGRRRRQC